VEYYNIYWDQGTGLDASWTLLATTSDLMYTVTGLTPGETYKFRIVAHNAAGDGLGSNESEWIAMPRESLLP